MKKSGFKRKPYQEVVDDAIRKSLRKAENSPKRGLRASKTKKKTKSLSKWKKELDAVFSRYIRYRDDGQCYTCPKKDDPKRMQNGHFCPRQYLSLRFDEKNCHCQCYACNMLYNGQPTAYAMNLKKQYGDGIIEEFEMKRRDITKLDAIWYDEKIKEYTEKISTYFPSIL